MNNGSKLKAPARSEGVPTDGHIIHFRSPGSDATGTTNIINADRRLRILN
jgi:hypothetical protein